MTNDEPASAAPAPVLTNTRGGTPSEQNAWSQTALAPFSPLTEGREVTFTLRPEDFTAPQALATSGKTGGVTVQVLLIVAVQSMDWQLKSSAQGH